MTQVCRTNRCFTAHCVVPERTEDDLRRMIWQESPSAEHYYNDAFSLYDTIGYPGEHQSLPNKKETYRRETLFASRGGQLRIATLSGSFSAS